MLVTSPTATGSTPATTAIGIVAVTSLPPVVSILREAVFHRQALDIADSFQAATELFEDAADPARFVETFLVESWLEHLRQHERVTNADRVMQQHVQRFRLEGAPKVTHMIAAERD
jgi:Transmembrane secretion effector